MAMALLNTMPTTNDGNVLNATKAKMMKGKTTANMEKTGRKKVDDCRLLMVDRR